MLRLHNVNDIECPELAPYRSMRKMTDHRRQGLFVAEGHKVVTRLLETDFCIRSLLLTQEWFDTLKAKLEHRRGAIDVFITDKNGIEKLTGFGCFQAIKAVANVPASPDLDLLCHSAVSPKFFVAIDGLTSAENVGALVRNAVGFGAQAIIVGQNSCSPYIRRAVHASMGTVFKIPVVHSSDLTQTLDFLRKRKVRLVAAHPHTDEVSLHQTNFNQDVCVILGSEGDGLCEDILALCDDQVLIPMAHDTDSLNVASAASVFFYEVMRQRIS